MFLEQQISILELFLKDHVMLKTGVMMLKIQLCQHSNVTIVHNIVNYFLLFLTK